MVNFVTKKDGSRVPFDREKMNASIMAACNDAEIPEDKTDAVIKEISGLVLMDLEKSEEVSSTEIKNMILSQLDTLHPEGANAWRHYEEGKSE